MVSCATVKSPLGLLKCILIVSCLMQITLWQVNCPHIHGGGMASIELDRYEDIPQKSMPTKN